jgi:hypothetical protein
MTRAHMQPPPLARGPPGAGSGGGGSGSGGGGGKKGAPPSEATEGGEGEPEFEPSEIQR